MTKLIKNTKNDKKLNAILGLTGVLHTHSRRLEYHPHVHFIVPNGGLSPDKKYWKQKTGKYLFNGKKLASVFRAKFIDAINGSPNVNRWVEVSRLTCTWHDTFIVASSLKKTSLTMNRVRSPSSIRKTKVNNG